jgi:hypothetical protein
VYLYRYVDIAHEITRGEERKAVYGSVGRHAGKGLTYFAFLRRLSFISVTNWGNLFVRRKKTPCCQLFIYALKVRLLLQIKMLKSTFK